MDVDLVVTSFDAHVLQGVTARGNVESTAWRSGMLATFSVHTCVPR